MKTKTEKAVIRTIVSKELSRPGSIVFLTLDCGHTVAFTAGPVARDATTAHCHQCAQKKGA